MAMQSTTDLLQTSPLVERLIRRSIQPVGLIGGGQGTGATPRLPPAVLRRASMVERLNARSINTSVEPMGSEMLVHKSPHPRGDLEPKPAAEVTSLSPRSSVFEGPFRIRRQTYSHAQWLQRHNQNDAIGQMPIPVSGNEAGFSKPAAEQIADEEEHQIRRQRIPVGEIQKQQMPADGNSDIGSIRGTTSLAPRAEMETGEDTHLVRRSVQVNPLATHEQSFPQIRPKPVQRQAIASEPARIQAKGISSAKEIQSLSLSPNNNINPSIVWRNASILSDLNPRSTTVSPAGANKNYLQAQPISPFQSASLERSSTRSMPSNPRAQSSAVLLNQTLNLREVAEEVSHILGRQWTLERERRGMDS